MAENKSNLSKGEDKKGFNLSKSSEPKANRFNLSKEQAPASNAIGNEGTKKSKLWLWLSLAVVIIVGVVLIAKNYSSDKTDKNLIDKTELATAKANDIILDVQSGTVNYEDAKAKITGVQNTVDEAKANAKTDEEKQAVAEAQTKVDEAVKTVEASKPTTQPLETDKTVTPEQGEGVASTTPVETSTTVQATSEKPVANTSNDAKSPTNKPNTNATSAPAVSVPEGTLEQKAKQVIRGNFGNGADRKRALGSEYNAIQGKVNDMYRNGEVK